MPGCFNPDQQQTNRQTFGADPMPVLGVASRSKKKKKKIEYQSCILAGDVAVFFGILALRHNGDQDTVVNAC